MGGMTQIGPPEANATKFQNMLEQVAKLLKATGGPLAGAPGTTQTGTAARTPGIPNPQPPVMPQGSMAAALPQMQPQGPMPQAPSAFGGVTPGRETAGGSFQYATPKARNAAVVTNAIQQFSQLAQGIHQKKFEEQVAEATQVWQTYLQKTKALEAAKQSGDQEQIQAAQQDLQNFAQDKKIAKILSTVSDPKKAMSPQSIGLQRAMQASQQQAVQQAELEKTQAETRQKQSQAAQEEATAAWRRRQEQMVGQVTPEQESRQQAEQVRTDTIVQGLSQRGKDAAAAKLTQLDKQITSMEKIASGHDAMLLKIAKVHEKDKDLSAVSKEATILNAQINGLNKEQKDLMDSLKGIHPVDWLNGTSAATEAKISNINGQRQILQKQLQSLGEKILVMSSVGKIPISTDVPDVPLGQEKQNDIPDVSDDEILKLLQPSSDASKGSQYSEN